MHGFALTTEMDVRMSAAELLPHSGTWPFCKQAWNGLHISLAAVLSNHERELFPVITLGAGRGLQKLNTAWVV